MIHDFLNISSARFKELAEIVCDYPSKSPNGVTVNEVLSNSLKLINETNNTTQYEKIIMAFVLGGFFEKSIKMTKR